ncbi:MAG: hypothetical protein BGO44_04405 [Legionella sp. 39-23]|nr:MAG: hypothetical protein BGO44_04405 [Legionella sp. 39-23]
MVNTLEIFFDKEGLPSNSTIYVDGDNVHCQLIPAKTDQPSLSGNFPKMKFNIVVNFGDKSITYGFVLSSPSQVKCKMNSKLNCNKQTLTNQNSIK